MHRISYKSLVPARTVGSCGIDKIHAEIDSVPQKFLGAFPVCIWTEITRLTGEPHRSITQTSNLFVIRYCESFCRDHTNRSAPFLRLSKSSRVLAFMRMSSIIKFLCYSPQVLPTIWLDR